MRSNEPPVGRWIIDLEVWILRFDLEVCILRFDLEVWILRFNLEVICSGLEVWSRRLINLRHWS